jgi:hypothetical protein
MAGIAALVTIFTALFAAPLALGSYVVVQRANPPVLLAWFGFLTALFVVALAAGAFALLITLP